MASVEELLAKYGKTDVTTSNTIPKTREPSTVENLLDEDTSPQELPFQQDTVETSEPVAEPSPFDNFTHLEDETIGSSYEQGQGVTNSDGRRLIADSFYNEDPQNIETPEKIDSTPSVSGFNFEDEEEDFNFTHPYDETSTFSTVEATDSRQAGEFQEPQKENMTLAQESPAPFADTDAPTPSETYTGSVTYQNDSTPYPQVYVDPSSPTTSTAQTSAPSSVDDYSVQNEHQPSQDPEDLGALATQLTVLMPAPAETHAGLAAFSTFMFPPFGAVAVHHAMKTFTTAYNGEKEESASHSSKAVAWSIAAIVAGILLIALFGAYKYDSTLFDSLFNKLGVLDN